MAIAVQNGINTLMAGVLRLPCLFASMTGAMLVGEGAYRVMKYALGQVGFTGDGEWMKKINENTPAYLGSIMRPYAKLSTQQLAISAICACAIGAVGSSFVRLTFGEAPPVYNRVLTYLGNIRISSNHHPLIQMGLSRIGIRG